MSEQSSSAVAAGSTSGHFAPVEAKPDHPALEHEMLAVWEQRRPFDRLRERNTGGPKFSFIDGPITANNPMGVHHAWGRTLKDIYQRLYAMRGYDQRYQNGFDCQGLWVEVEVEKALGLNSKREIEAHGLDKFSIACRERVATYADVQTKQSIRLGQWMRWDSSYFTLSDTNISYIWNFLAECHERGWLYLGNRPMVWCPRCGTSLSQHELIDSYKDVTHPSLFVRFPLVDREHESLAVWTTTPWTLPANVAAAVLADAEYTAVETEHGHVWVATDRVQAVFGDDAVTHGRCKGTELIGLRYTGPFADLAAAQPAQYRVVGWTEVSMDEGTGIVHIAPGCGAEDYELGKQEELAEIAPVDDAGVFRDGFGLLTGKTTHEAAPLVIEDLTARGILIRAGKITHRFPTCWRCGTELIFRLVEEWFISCDEIRERMIEANREVEWSPAFYGKRMEDWLNNMGDWCISRKRYWGLPLPFYHCHSCEEMVVLRSKEDLERYAVSGLENLKELHRPWIDDVVIECPKCKEHLYRIPEVGDCWLDAGIVPFSTTGWRNPEHIPGGYATGASVGLSVAELPSHEEWEQWFPADLVIEMREQIRLWFYSMLFMSVVLEDRAPYKRVLAYEKVQDETGRPMHKSWGNAIWFDDAVEQMGADIMRWQYAAQTPGQNLNFGYGPASEIKRRFLTLWNVYSFFVTYANLDGYEPGQEIVRHTGTQDGAGLGLATLRPAELSNRLDRWLAARTHQLVSEVDAAFDRWDTPAYTRAVERYVEELSNWYVRRSRRRFWKAEEGELDREEAYNTLWSALVTVTRVLAPVMPFLADRMWGNLVGTRAGSHMDSVHLSPWPVPDPVAAQHPLLRDVAAVQRVVGLGRAARSEAQLKLRQPLREVVVFHRGSRGKGTADIESMLRDHLDDLRAELSIKNVTVVDQPGGRWDETLMPLLPKLGPKYGKQVADIRKAIAEGDVGLREDGTMRVGAFALEPDEFEHRSVAAGDWAVAEDLEWVVAVSTDLDDDLVLEGLAREVVRQLQIARRDSGFDIDDRVTLTWQAGGRVRDALERHADMIADEVLCTTYEQGAVEDGREFEIEGERVSVALSRAE